MGKRTSIYVSDDLKKTLRLDKNHGLSEAINESIDRYHEIIGSERKRVEGMFTEAEWNAMRNACNGTIWQPAAIIRGGVLANVQDSLDDEIVSYGADHAILEDKLAGLSVVQQFALVDMIEEWWHETTAPRFILSFYHAGNLITEEKNLTIADVRKIIEGRYPDHEWPEDDDAFLDEVRTFDRQGVRLD